jgi:hypothetical protein
MYNQNSSYSPKAWGQMVGTAVVNITQGRRSKALPESYGYRSIAVAVARLAKSHSSTSSLRVLVRVIIPPVLDRLPPPLPEDLFVDDILESCGIATWLERAHAIDVITDGARC